MTDCTKVANPTQGVRMPSLADKPGPPPGGVYRAFSPSLVIRPEHSLRPKTSVNAARLHVVRFVIGVYQDNPGCWRKGYNASINKP